MHHFKYLGSKVEETGGTTTEISQRVSAAWRNGKRCSGVLCDRRMPVKLKGKVDKTVVLGNNEITRRTDKLIVHSI